MKQTEILNRVTHKQLDELHQTKSPFMLFIEFFRSKLSFLFAHVSKRATVWAKEASNFGPLDSFHPKQSFPHKFTWPGSRPTITALRHIFRSLASLFKLALNASE